MDINLWITNVYVVFSFVNTPPLYTASISSNNTPSCHPQSYFLILKCQGQGLKAQAHSRL